MSPYNFIGGLSGGGGKIKYFLMGWNFSPAANVGTGVASSSSSSSISGTHHLRVRKSGEDKGKRRQLLLKARADRVRKKAEVSWWISNQLPCGAKLHVHIVISCDRSHDDHYNNTDTVHVVMVININCIIVSTGTNYLGNNS